MHTVLNGLDMSPGRTSTPRIDGLITEQADPRFGLLDEMTVGEIVTMMNTADFDVPRAIEAALPQIAPRSGPPSPGSRPVAG